MKTKTARINLRLIFSLLAIVSLLTAGLINLISQNTWAGIPINGIENFNKPMDGTALSTMILFLICLCSFLIGAILEPAEKEICELKESSEKSDFSN